MILDRSTLFGDKPKIIDTGRRESALL